MDIAPQQPKEAWHHLSRTLQLMFWPHTGCLAVLMRRVNSFALLKLLPTCYWQDSHGRKQSDAKRSVHLFGLIGLQSSNTLTDFKGS